jgi:RNA polymerase sigma-70 factor (ECF subfamily)
MTASDQMLVRRAQKGDVDAFEALVRNHERRVYNLCLRLMGNDEDAMDAAQETLLKAWRHLSSFRGASAFSTWLYRVTVNVCNDMLRKRRPPSLSVEILQETGRDLADPLAGDFTDRTASVQMVLEGLRRLSPDHRTVLVLRDVQGFSYEEIGELLDCPTGTVRSRLSRARRNLSDLLRVMEQKTESIRLKG